MKLHLISDLHLDSADMMPPEGVEADVSAILGDIHEGILGLPFVKAVADLRPTIVVPGNHEFYGSSLAQVRQKWRAVAAENPNIIFLDNDVWIHKGVRFIGATLWVDFDNQNPLKLIQGQDVVKDFMYIVNAEGDDTIRPDEILAEHLKSKQFILDELAKPFDGHTVVLTHHSPTHGSVAEVYANNPHNYMFCSDLDKIFYYNDFLLWAHGHMHNSSFHQIDGKWVINNPRGTPRHPNPHFDPAKVLDLDNLSK
jgi:hypothetical protein